MDNIKVNQDEMLANIKKIDKAVTSYEKHCKELDEMLKANEAQLDELTQASLSKSLDTIRQKFSNISRIIKERNKILQMIAETYRNVNDGNGAAAVVVGAAEGLSIALEPLNGSGTGGHF